MLPAALLTKGASTAPRGETMARRFVIRATGPARPGQTATLSTALATAGLRLLDMDQHVAFGQVRLEALVETDDEVDHALQAPGLQRIEH